MKPNIVRIFGKEFALSETPSFKSVLLIGVISILATAFVIFLFIQSAKALSFLTGIPTLAFVLLSFVLTTSLKFDGVDKTLLSEFSQTMYFHLLCVIAIMFNLTVEKSYVSCIFIFIPFLIAISTKTGYLFVVFSFADKNQTRS